jgi:predicted DNA-binding protein YlxM (UPF0122 family)
VKLAAVSCKQPPPLPLEDEYQMPDRAASYLLPASHAASAMYLGLAPSSTQDLISIELTASSVMENRVTVIQLQSTLVPMTWLTGMYHRIAPIHAAAIVPVTKVNTVRCLARRAAAIVLFYREDRSLQEIAEMLDTPENTVKTWLHRGRNEFLQDCSLSRRTIMSDNEHITEAFDQWLTEGLKQPQPVSPDFEQNLIRKVERLAAQRMLRKVAWQERILGWATEIAAGVGLAALCYPPILRSVYDGAKCVLEAFILAVAQPSKLNLTGLALVAACLVVLGGVLWDRLAPQRG